MTTWKTNNKQTDKHNSNNDYIENKLEQTNT